MKLSIIVPTFNEAKWLRRSMPAILGVRPKCEHEFIFVNDCSTDETGEVLAKFADDIQIIQPEQRIGTARSRRLGVEHAVGEVLCFIDAHVWPDPGFFDALAETALNRPKSVIVPGLVQHRLTDPWTPFPEKPKTNWGGGLSFTVRKFWFYLSVNRHKNQHERRVGAYACGMTMTRRLYDYLGGWVSLPGYWSSSDAAMCIKCWLTDTPLVVETDAHLFHGVKGFGPHETPKAHEVMNRLYAARVLFAPKTFRRFWLPAWKKRFGRHMDRMDYMSVLNDPAVVAEHKRFRRIIKHTDKEFLEERIYPTIDKCGASRSPTADFMPPPPVKAP